MATPLELLRHRLCLADLSAYCVDAPENARDPHIVLTPYNSEDFDAAPAYWEYVQVRTTGSDYRVTERAAWQCYNALNGMGLEEADRRVLSAVFPQGTPYYLGRDEAGRYVFTFDVRYAAEYPKGDA